MTQYGIRATFDDEEKETLQAAIDHYLEVCRREIKNGGSAPFYAYKGLLTRHRVLRQAVHKWPPALPLGDGEWSTIEKALVRTRDHKRCNHAVCISPSNHRQAPQEDLG